MPNTTSNSARTGIRDWNAKRSLLRSLYDVSTDKSLVQAVVEAWTCDDETLAATVDRLYDTYRRWGKSKPSNVQSRKFWRQVMKDKGADSGMEVLWSGSIVEFAAAFALDKGIQNAVEDLLFDHHDKLDSSSLNQLRDCYGIAFQIEQRPDDQYDFRAYAPLRFEGPQTGVLKGHIQSTQFYNMPEAALAWSEMVDSQNYRIYLDCLRSLKALVKSEAWTQALQRGCYDAAVALGGGASPEKDWVLVESMAAGLHMNGDPLTYVVNDISPYMLQLSARILSRRREKSDTRGRVNFKYHWFDFLRIDEHFTRPSRRSTVWSILGGTIGNLSESRFFESINGVSRLDDLLIVSIDTLDGGSQNDFQDRMSREYRSGELDRLLLSSLRGWSDTVGGKSLRVDVSTRMYAANDPLNLSDVPGSSTAVFSVKTPRGEQESTVLAHSTRYSRQSLIEFAAKYGWEYETSSQAPNGSTFRQILFRRFEQ